MSAYFSIIIPMYNRERFIARAIDSCLAQGFQEYEIIVVDDGSTDNSASVVRKYTDPRIRLLCHEVNRGVGPARNTGAGVATGEWIVWLDSDDELCPDALSIMHKRSSEVGENISRMQFMGRIDTGGLSPQPPLKNEFWDYVKYIQWSETLSAQTDTTPVVKRVTFEKVRFNDDRTLEGPYHLDFMKEFNAWAFPDVVARYHQDAGNQITKPEMNRVLQSARDQALSGEHMLRIHGEARRKYSPRVYKRFIAGLATLWFLSGNRMKGMRYSFMSLGADCFSIRSWVVLVAGMISPKLLAWLKCRRGGR
jgi:glycosyltransferase involved in cell wall biosynthesis